MRTLALAAPVALLLGCGSPTTNPDATPATVEITPTANAEIQAQETTVAILVPSIVCEGCAAGVCAALEAEEGVVGVEVDVATKVATLRVDEAEFLADSALAALERAKFEGSQILDEAEAAQPPSSVEEPTEDS